MRRVLFIFGQLSDDDIEWLVTHGERHEAPKGETLIRQGVHVESLYFLIEGKMAVDAAGIGRVGLLGNGEVIGEMSFIDSSPPSATVVAQEDCLLLKIDKQAILAHMERDHGFASRFYKALAIFLSNRLRDTTLQLRGEKAPAEDELGDQLDDVVLKTVHLAGYRFNRLVERVQK